MIVETGRKLIFDNLKNYEFVAYLCTDAETTYVMPDETFEHNSDYIECPLTKIQDNNNIDQDSIYFDDDNLVMTVYLVGKKTPDSTTKKITNVQLTYIEYLDEEKEEKKEHLFSKELVQPFYIDNSSDINITFENQF